LARDLARHLRSMFCKLFIFKHLRRAAGARRRKSLIFNALLVRPTAKKLCLAREFFLDTHGE
jgi:hypothetical protein